MRWRPAPLLLAVLAAGGFVIGRLVYGAVFGGLAAGEPVLLDLPRLRLAGPFAHVTLFGPVTGSAIPRAIMAALPFALTILAFGAVAAVLDVRRGLARLAGSGPLRGLGRALVVAWDAVPALVDAVRRVATANRLRGRAPSIRLLVPVFERSIERAVALGTSMDVRGMGGSAPDFPRPDRPVRTAGVRLRRPGWSLAVPDLDLRPGTVTLLSGPTGSGKSSLLHALAGTLQHADEAEQTGTLLIGGVDRLRLPPRDAASYVALVAQRVKHAFVAETVRDEIGFSLVLRGEPATEVRARVASLAERLRISHLLDRSTARLSAGEAVRVALAAALAIRPRLLLLDEPLAELDHDARGRLVALIRELADERDVCVVIAEHRRRWLAGVVDREVRLGEPRPVAVGIREPDVTELSGAFVAPESAAVRLPFAPAMPREAPDAPEPRIHAIVGPNGVGKSTLLLRRALADIGSVALVPEELEDLFLTDTAGRECQLADRAPRPRRARDSPLDPERQGTHRAPRGRREPAAAGRTLALWSRLLGCDATELTQRHPRDCSGGERLCLALAIQLVREPQELLVDEPFRGLDATAVAEVMAALREAARLGTAVTIATHERDLARALAATVEELALGAAAAAGLAEAPRKGPAEQAAAHGAAPTSPEVVA